MTPIARDRGRSGILTPPFPDESRAVKVTSRVTAAAVALETTLLCHGVPKANAPALAVRIDDAIKQSGASPALVGVVRGVPTVGMTADELRLLLEVDHVPKLNTANLGVTLHRRSHGATTVAATMELAAAAGVEVFATGGIGGVHKGYGDRLDISADLAALTRFPVAVVASGVKSILDVASTREALETLGVPVVGYRTDSFPAFYVRETDLPVDARFDDEADLAAFVHAELARIGRGVLVCNPCPEAHAFTQAEFDVALAEAERATAGASGRDATPAVLAALHERSGGRTLTTNIELAVSNAALAGRIAAAIASL